MKKYTLLCFLIIQLSLFGQTAKFFFIQHLSANGLQMISCKESIATHYSTVDPDLVTSGYVNYYFMNGGLHSAEYYENRILEKKKVYHKNGKKSYVERRTMEEIGSAGMIDGYNVPLYVFPLQLVAAWDTNGQKIAKDGNGLVMETDTSGNLLCLRKIKKVNVYTITEELQGFYRNGNFMFQRNGDRIIYAKNISGDTVIHNGNGFFISHFSNDSLFAQFIYHNGMISNDVQYYYPNGQKQNAVNLPDGKCVYYYDNGQIRLSGEWLKGNKYGEWNWYNKKGALVEKKVYTEFNLFRDRMF